MAAKAPEPRKALDDFVEGLKRDGYVVRFDAVMAGQSGVVHRFDIVAEKAEGGGEKKTVVFMKTRGMNPAQEMIGLFAMAFDVDAEPCYVVRGSVEEKIVRQYGITLLAGE